MYLNTDKYKCNFWKHMKNISKYTKHFNLNPNSKIWDFNWLTNYLFLKKDQSIKKLSQTIWIKQIEVAITKTIPK